MTSETFKIAYKRAKEGLASKAELKVLIKWAETEIAEWNNFIEMINKKLTK